MNKEALPGGLVLINPIGSKLEPATVAEYAQVKADTIRRLIQKHMTDLEEFGKVGFEIFAVSGSRTGQYAKLYHSKNPRV